MAAASSRARAAIGARSASSWTLRTVSWVSVQSVEVHKFCTSLAQIDWRTSSTGGEDRSAALSASRSARTSGVSSRSGRPMTSMLSPGTWFSITPGATISFAE